MSITALVSPEMPMEIEAEAIASGEKLNKNEDGGSRNESPASAISYANCERGRLAAAFFARRFFLCRFLCRLFGRFLRRLFGGFLCRRFRFLLGGWFFRHFLGWFGSRLFGRLLCRSFLWSWSWNWSLLLRRLRLLPAATTGRTH